MSTVVVASVKGSPGVTALACLLGGTWPCPDRAVVAECDPGGGDLAARFALSARQGWVSLAASIRRRGPGGPLAEHLQTLPGGLRVLLGNRETVPESGGLVRCFDGVPGRFSDGPWDVVVDLGRILPGNHAQWCWLEAADVVLVLLRADAASVLHVKGFSDELGEDGRRDVKLVTVGRADRPDEEIERFVGLPIVARMPEDRTCARLVCGEPGPGRRLRRSSLVASAAELARRVAEGPQLAETAGKGRRGAAAGKGRRRIADVEGRDRKDQRAADAETETDAGPAPAPPSGLSVGAAKITAVAGRPAR